MYISILQAYHVLPLESIESGSTTQDLRGKTQDILEDHMNKLAGPNKAKFSSSHQKWKGFTWITSMVNRTPVAYIRIITP